MIGRVFMKVDDHYGNGKKIKFALDPLSNLLLNREIFWENLLSLCK
jgi:hypothetical protein